MIKYLDKILKESISDKDLYSQEELEKTERLVSKLKKFLKLLRPSENLCSILIVATPPSIVIFPIFSNDLLAWAETNKIKNKINSVFSNKVLVMDWHGGSVDCEHFKELANKVIEDPDYKGQFVFFEHKDKELTEKWSQKYKRTIDCNNPKGFSQRAHCQGRKKRDLDEYGRTLKMARRQGVGTRFPKSAIKSNPSRFRNYTREMNEESLKHLDKVVELCRLLNEEKKPDFEWEFEVKKNVDKSLDWVKTKDEAITYIKKLFDKIKNVSENLKHKILKYVIYSFVGILTITQMNTIYDGLTKEKPNLKKIEVIGGGNKEEKKNQKIRDYNESLVKHMKYEEGSITDKGEPVLVAYNIGDGAKTIGFGHAIFSDESRGNTGGDYPFIPKYNKIVVGKTKITKKQAEELLRDDLDKTKKELNRILDKWEEDGITPDIDQDMYNAMISMMFNMGVGNFRTSEFIQYVKRNQMDKAKEQIKKESARSFNKFPGLKDRREKESEMFGGKKLNESEEKSSLQKKLEKLIKDKGLDYAVDSVGGYRNVTRILGDSIISDILLNRFKDLHIEKRGSNIFLMNGGLPILENMSSFWGLGLQVFDDYITDFLGDELEKLYFDNRKRFIKKLVSEFPELYNNEVTVYKDSGKYLKIAEFNLESDSKNINESKEKSSLKKKLEKLIKNKGIGVALSAVGGAKNLINIFDKDISIIKDNIKPPYGLNMWKMGLSNDEQLDIFKAIFGDDIDVWGYDSGGDIYVENPKGEFLYYEEYDGTRWHF